MKKYTVPHIILLSVVIIGILVLSYPFVRPSNKSAKIKPLNDTISINNIVRPADVSIHVNIPKIDSLPRIDTLKILKLKKVREIDTLEIDTLKKEQEIDTLKLTDKEKKKIENIERIENIDKNLEVIDKQKITLDSLKIKKKK